MVDRRAERGEPEGPKREPELERPRAPRQLKAVIGEVDEAVLRLCVAKVVRRDLEGAPEGSSVADEQATALVRLVEPLVRVECDRVGELEAGKRATAALCEDCETAVGRV